MIFDFLTAVRECKPVEDLERLRTTIGYEWENDSDMHSLLEAMRYALLYEHSAYVTYIMDNYADKLIHADICCPFLLLAVRLNRQEIVEMICNYCGETAKHSDVDYINAKGCVSMGMGKTALHTACELGLYACLRILLQNGANQMCIDSNGMTPLECVLNAEFCSYEMFECAIELARHREQLQWDTIALLGVLHSRFHQDRHTDRHDAICKMCSFLPTQMQPSALAHLSVHAVRNSLGMKLAHSVNKLPIPSRIKDSISFRIADDTKDKCRHTRHVCFDCTLVTE